jgi:hypothetical protein
VKLESKSAPFGKRRMRHPNELNFLGGEGCAARHTDTINEFWMDLNYCGR